MSSTWSSSRCPNQRLLGQLYGARLRTLHQQLQELLPHPAVRASEIEPAKRANGTSVCATDGGELARPGSMRASGDEIDANGSTEWNAEFTGVVSVLEPWQQGDGAAEERGDGIGLIRPGDCVEYVTLLEKSYAVMAENAGRIGGVSVNQRWSQQQVVERVIELQLRQEGASSNVLCFGYGQNFIQKSAGVLFTTPQGDHVRATGLRAEHHSAPQGLDYYLNVAAAFVSTHLWATLLSRVGEEAMLYLLSHAAIFVPLPNHCLLQVAGHAVSKAAFDMKQIPRLISTSSVTQFKLQTRLQQQASSSKATSLNKNMEFGSSGLTVRGEHSLHVPGGSSVSSKRVRPPSWLRRREGVEQKLLDVASSSSMTKSSKKTADVSAPAMHQKRRPLTLQHSSVVMTEPPCITQEPRRHIQAKGFHARGASTRSRMDYIGDSGVNKVAVSRPVHRVGPSERFIQRSPIFYNSSFSCHAGLPANHILNTTEVSDAGIGQLFGSIFEGLGRSDTCDTTSEGASSSDKAKEKDMVKDLKGLLMKMVRNARCCNYARLLGRHCPLPSYSLPSHLKPICSENRSESQAKKQASSGSKLFNSLEEGYATQEEDIEKESLSFAGVGPHIAGLSKEMMFMQETHTRPVTKGTYSRVADYSAKTLDNTGGGIRKFEKRFTTVKSSKPAKKGPRGNPTHAKPFGDEKMLKRPTVEGTACEKNGRKGAVRSTIALTELVTCSTKHSQVVAFLWAVCRSLIPEELLGATCYQRRLCSSIASFVSLRRHEIFHVQHILNKLQLSGCTWLNQREIYQRTSSRAPRMCATQMKTQKAGSSPHFRALQQMMLQDWLHWLFTGLIVPLLRTHFYATETENHRQNVLYYRKPVWAKIQLLSLRDLASKCYTKLDPSMVATLLQKRALGFSQIRMLPKQSGVRPIGNLSSVSKCALPLTVDLQNAYEAFGLCGKPRQSALNDSREYLVDMQQANLSRIGMKQVKFLFKSINSVLKGAHVCLKYEQEHHPEDLGASVFGYKDTYIKLLPFIVHLKGASGGLPPVYMAVCDVSRAYDTIKQDKLCEVVSAFLRLPVYVVQRYAAIFLTMGYVRASYTRACTHSDQPRVLLDTFVDITARRSHSILHDQGGVKRLKQEQILALIEEHVKRNIVKIGSQFYLQKTGIPQGSVLSPLLCSVFFGHLDTHFLMPLLQQSARLASPCGRDRRIPSKLEELDRNSHSESTRFSLPKMTQNHINFMVESEHSVCVDLESMETEPFEVLQSLQSAKEEITAPSATAPSEVPKGPPGNDESILLRLIDDSLFISTSQDIAAQFVQIMHNGFEDYGCHANRQKSTVSFDLQLNENQEKIARNVYLTDDGACFIPWSGLLINCCTLEIQADYTRCLSASLSPHLLAYSISGKFLPKEISARYVGEPLKGTLTVVRKKNPGSQVPIKLCHFVRAKCHPLLYDQRINSPSTVRLNAYQAFLLCAMKFHAYLCSMPHTSHHHPPFLLKAIGVASSYMYGLLRKQMQEMGAGAHLGMAKEEVKWLALHAFRKVLRRKQSRYPTLLSLIQERLDMPKYGPMNCCPHLASAMHEERSTMFKRIVY